MSLRISTAAGDAGAFDRVTGIADDDDADDDAVRSDKATRAEITRIADLYLTGIFSTGNRFRL